MSSDLDVPRFNVFDADWKPLPKYGGHEAILYRSPDGTRVAATFRESGAFTFVYPFDELVYVVAGSTKVAVRGGESFELKQGDIAYFREGMVVDFEMSKDFHDVTCLMSTEPVGY